MRRFFPKWLVAAAAALLVSGGLAYGVVVSGTNSQNEYSILKVGYVRYSVTDTITAFAGGGQASAVLLDSAYNRVTTVGTAADSVKLPTCVTGTASNTGGLSNTQGMIVWVTNAAAANSMNVFPQSGQAINALANDAAYAMAANKTSGFICGTNGKWYSVLGG